MKNSRKKIGKESVHLCLQAINSEMRILLLLEFHVSYANKDTGKDKQMHRILFANWYVHPFVHSTTHLFY